MDSDLIIISCEKNDEGEAYTVAFSSGESLSSLSYDEISELGLYRTGESCGNYDKICTDLLSGRIMALISSYVLFTSRTRAQVIQYISDREYKLTGEDRALSEHLPDAVSNTLELLKELGYVDDEKYARKYVRSALKGKPVSRTELAGKLIYTKGISKEIAEAALEEAYSEEGGASDSEAAYTLLKQKTKGTVPEDRNELAKLYRYMAGKGFSARDAEKALTRIKNEEAYGHND